MRYVFIFFFILISPNNGSESKVFTTIIARERAPLNATRDMFKEDVALGQKGTLILSILC